LAIRWSIIQSLTRESLFWSYRNIYFSPVLYALNLANYVCGIEDLRRVNPSKDANFLGEVQHTVQLNYTETFSHKIISRFMTIMPWSF